MNSEKRENSSNFHRAAILAEREVRWRAENLQHRISNVGSLYIPISLSLSGALDATSKCCQGWSRGVTSALLELELVWINDDPPISALNGHELLENAKSWARFTVTTFYQSKLGSFLKYTKPKSKGSLGSRCSRCPVGSCFARGMHAASAFPRFSLACRWSLLMWVNSVLDYAWARMHAHDFQNEVSLGEIRCWDSAFTTSNSDATTGRWTFESYR